MKSKTVMLLGGITLLVFLSTPIWPAAQEHSQQAEHAAKPETGTTNPVPLINQPLVPDAVAPGGVGFTLTVNGTGFISGSVVNWNGSAVATTFVSGSQLTASVPASDIATASTASISVVNPGLGGGTSDVAFFPITNSSSTVALSGSTYAVGVNPHWVSTGDLNGDGKLDLVTGNVGDGTVSILLGNGHGTFQTQAVFPAGVTPYGGSAGDFNHV